MGPDLHQMVSPSTDCSRTKSVPKLCEKQVSKSSPERWILAEAARENQLTIAMKADRRTAVFQAISGKERRKCCKIVGFPTILVISPVSRKGHRPK